MESRTGRMLENSAAFGVLFATETVVAAVCDAVRDPNIDNYSDSAAIAAGFIIASLFTASIDQYLEWCNRQDK